MPAVQTDDKEQYDSLALNPLINTSEPARTVEDVLRGYEPVADGHGNPKGFDLDKDGRTEFGYYWEFEDMAEAAEKIAAVIKARETALINSTLEALPEEREALPSMSKEAQTYSLGYSAAIRNSREAIEKLRPGLRPGEENGD